MTEKSGQLKEAIAELKELKLCIIGRSQRIWIDREASEAIDTVLAHIKEHPPQLTIDRVNAMLTTNSRETWVAAKGSSEGWKEWFAKRNTVHLNKGEESE